MHEPSQINTEIYGHTILGGNFGTTAAWTSRRRSSTVAKQSEEETIGIAEAIFTKQSKPMIRIVIYV